MTKDNIDKLCGGADEISKSKRYHSVGLCCVTPNCSKKDFVGDHEYDAQNAVGISKVREGSFSRRDFAITIKCPGCAKHYWFHISNYYATIINELRNELENKE